MKGRSAKKLEQLKSLSFENTRGDVRKLRSLREKEINVKQIICHPTAFDEPVFQSRWLQVNDKNDSRYKL